MNHSCTVRKLKKNLSNDKYQSKWIAICREIISKREIMQLENKSYTKLLDFLCANQWVIFHHETERCRCSWTPATTIITIDLNLIPNEAYYIMRIAYTGFSCTLRPRRSPVHSSCKFWVILVPNALWSIRRNYCTVRQSFSAVRVHTSRRCAGSLMLVAVQTRPCFDVSQFFCHHTMVLRTYRDKSPALGHR
jgi:hypothetical protein